MFQMLGVISEFKRATTREPINAGLARAKAEGKTLGRPKTSIDTEQAIIQALANGGKGMQKIAKEFGVGTSVVQRLAKAKAE